MAAPFQLRLDDCPVQEARRTSWLRCSKSENDPSGHRAKRRAAHAHFSLAARNPTTEVAKTDAKLEKLQQLSRRPLKEQTSFQKQKLAL
jgi:hypothetical protein